jgi:hypothetical protein
MGLPDTGRPEQQQRFTVRNPAAGRQLAQMAGIERGLGGEVEGLEVAHAGKMGDLDPHLDPSLVLAGDLALAQKGQRLAQGQLAPGRLVDQVVQLVSDGGELQPRQPSRQDLMIYGHHQLPPTQRSYSSSGRRSAGSGAASGWRNHGVAPATPWK